MQQVWNKIIGGLGDISVFVINGQVFLGFCVVVVLLVLCRPEMCWAHLTTDVLMVILPPNWELCSSPCFVEKSKFMPVDNLHLQELTTGTVI